MDGTTFFNFLNAFSAQIGKLTHAGLENLQPALMVTLTSLGVIAIITNWEMYFSANFSFGNIFVKLIQIGFYGFMIKNWDKFLVMMQTSAEQVGLLAGGQTAMIEISKFLEKYVGTIYATIGKVWEDYSFMNDNMLLIGLTIFVLFLTIFFFFAIGFEIFCATNEFIIIGNLLAVLLPFNVLRFTAGMGEKVWGGILSIFVKLMVAVFFFSLATAIVDSAMTAQNMSEISKKTVGDALPQLIMQFASMAFLYYLMKQTSNLAGALVNGSIMHSAPNLVANAGAAAGGLAARGGAVAGGAVAGAVTRAGKAGGRVLYDYGKRTASHVAGEVRQAADTAGRAVYRYGKNKNWW